MMRTKAFAAIGALVLSAAACAGDRAPLAPRADVPAAETSLDASPPRAETAPLPPATIGEGTTLLRAVPLANDLTVSRIIGPSGGELEIPEAGLRVVVPRGALTRSTTITATALAGDMVAYEFGPHGTRFTRPLVVVQQTASTDFGSLPAGTLVQAGYFTGPDALDRATKKARLAEVIPTLGISTGTDIAFFVWHFSGYTVQWGFKGRGDDDAQR
jgi:hypothetical protein